MVEQSMSREVVLFRRAIQGAVAGLGILIGSIGVAEVGWLRVLGLAIGLLALAAAFTQLPESLASRFVERTGGKRSRFYLAWISVGSIILPPGAALLPAMGLAAGVPLDAGSAALIVGPTVAGLLNLIVLVANLVESRAP
ncbi:MAG TPA: hypothetical protein VI729_10395 [Anaerolineales bacterium]|nr:hypothetical protein [Anaerolineales bacterium]